MVTSESIIWDPEHMTKNLKISQKKITQRHQKSKQNYVPPHYRKEKIIIKIYVHTFFEGAK